MQGKSHWPLSARAIHPCLSGRKRWVGPLTSKVSAFSYFPVFIDSSELAISHGYIDSFLCWFFPSGFLGLLVSFSKLFLKNEQFYIQFLISIL
jgi:hypothetical protein